MFFGLGEAVAALSFTLAFQQLLKPIYSFRLNARYLTIPGIDGFVFAGSASILFAVLSERFGLARHTTLLDPFPWQIIGTLLFIAAYGAVALAIVLPVRVAPRNAIEFARTAARLLSAANDRDHNDFANDLKRSLRELARLTSRYEHLDQVSAFYLFTHRVRLERAGYAASFLRIVADPSFCRTLVTQSPWQVVEMLNELSERKTDALSLSHFVRELAHQAITRHDSLMAREIDYHGFGEAPLLSDSLFADWFILDTFDPFDSFRQFDGTPDAALVRRFNSAAEKSLEIIVERSPVSDSQAALSIREFYEHVFLFAQRIRSDREKYEKLPLEMLWGIEAVIKSGKALVSRVSPRRYESLFLSPEEEFRHDLLDTLATIAYGALAQVSNKFTDSDDPFWMLVTGGTREIFPAFGKQPDGFTPFQQRVALKILENVDRNMEGFYPSISTVLLAWLGPYERKGRQPNNTAFNLFKDAVYAKLKLLPQLAESHPEKIADYLPTNVAYDTKKKTLTHTFFGGGTAITELEKLQIKPISFFEKEIRIPHERLKELGD